MAPNGRAGGSKAGGNRHYRVGWESEKQEPNRRKRLRKWKDVGGLDGKRM